MSYLANLTLRLAAGAGRLPHEVRSRHAGYLRAAQNHDGGFSGRGGPSDLYYTAFALRGLALLDALDEPIAVRTGRFLCGRLDAVLPSLDVISLVSAAVLVEGATGVDIFAQAGRDLPQSVVEFFEPLRRCDGGYAKTQRAGQSSTYHTFLVAACKELAGAPLEGSESMVALVRSRQREDGGFVEIGPMRYSGTNPTAAAVALLHMLDALDAATQQAAAGFLARIQTGEGGLRAHARIPVADLLSTFTGLAALGDLDALSAIDAAAARRFIDSAERTTGGFHAGTGDDAVDVEYTFYGLGGLALLVAAEG